MKKSIEELARELTSVAQKPYTCGIEINEDMNLKSVIIDYEEYFGKCSFQTYLKFCEECDKLGFEVVPIEFSSLAMMTHLHGEKLVIQEKAKAHGKNN